MNREEAVSAQLVHVAVSPTGVNVKGPRSVIWVGH